MKLVSILLFCLFSSAASPFRFPSLHNLKPRLSHLVEVSLNGTTCSSHLKEFVNDLETLKFWALNMFDATSKMHPGLLQGNLYLHGDYDQCLSIKHNLNGTQLKGKYCTVPLVLNENLLKTVLKMVKNISKSKLEKLMTFHYGLCIPKSCSVEHLKQLWSQVHKSFKFPFQLKFEENLCTYKGERVTWNKTDFTVVFLFFAILTVEVASTLHDIYERKNGKKPGLISCFSLYTNCKNLLSTCPSKDTLTCLYGIGSFSMLWIVGGHFGLFSMLTNSNNISYLTTEWAKRLENTFYVGAHYAVDTFFSVSGLLLVYVFLRGKDKKFNWCGFYLHRLVRLVPVLSAVILINVSAVKHLRSGPFSYKILNQKTNCESNWWATLFFANNLIKYSKQCIPHTWYLAVDFHLYALSPLFLPWLRKSPTKTFAAVSAVCALSFLYTWITVVKNNVGFVFLWETTDESAALVYLSTICRMPSWLIGTYFGFLLHRQKLKKIQIPKIVNLVLWIIAISVMLVLVLCTTIFFRREYSVYRSAFFNTFSRPLWCLSVCYIIFSCSTGHGGFINTLLSNSIFMVLSKLTYSTYLIHGIVFNLFNSYKKETFHFSNMDAFTDFWGVWIIVLGCAAVLNLMVEKPIIALSNYLRQRDQEIEDKKE